MVSNLLSSLGLDWFQTGLDRLDECIIIQLQQSKNDALYLSTQTKTNIVLNNTGIILLELPMIRAMIRGCLAQYFDSMDGRIQ